MSRLGLVLVGLSAFWHISLPIMEGLRADSGSPVTWMRVLDESHLLALGLLPLALAATGIWPRAWGLPVFLFAWLFLSGLVMWISFAPA